MLRGSLRRVAVALALLSLAASLAVAAAPTTATQSDNACAFDAARRVDVDDARELVEALADAEPGDLIRLADGTYDGTFVAENDGAADARITLCGGRDAVIDGGDVKGGYALHITADYWTVSGIAVTNAQKGIVLDGANFVLLDQVEVHTVGDEAVHFRAHSSDNVIQDSEIHDTGLRREKFGEGVYIGSAVSNWEKYSDGVEDCSDRNEVLRNRIWNTTAESIDIKEGTTGGLIEGNTLDGSALSGADSWVDVKGNEYVIRDNVGTNSPVDGYQTHVINNLDWGRDNLFEHNVAEVNGHGYGFYFHDPEESHNLVRCDNEVRGADAGFANVECE
jgi:hypothetical protein